MHLQLVSLCPSPWQASNLGTFNQVPQRGWTQQPSTLLAWKNNLAIQHLCHSATYAEMYQMWYAWLVSPARPIAYIIMQANQVVCYQTRTTLETHQLIRDSLHLSVHIQETKKGLFVLCIILCIINTWESSCYKDCVNCARYDGKARRRA